MSLENRIKVGALAVMNCSLRLNEPSNIKPGWKSTDLNKKEVELREKSRELAQKIYADLTKAIPSSAGSVGKIAAQMAAYDETFKDHKYGRCMTYAAITGRFIKNCGVPCKMVTVLMNDIDDSTNEHVFIVMGDSVSQGQDCANWDGNTVVCDEWISRHPKSLKNALGNIGIYKGSEFSEELKRLGYSTNVMRVIEIYAIKVDV
jgi:hypothetical protein